MFLKCILKTLSGFFLSCIHVDIVVISFKFVYKVNIKFGFKIGIKNPVKIARFMYSTHFFSGACADKCPLCRLTIHVSSAEILLSYDSHNNTAIAFTTQIKEIKFQNGRKLHTFNTFPSYCLLFQYRVLILVLAKW